MTLAASPELRRELEGLIERLENEVGLLKHLLAGPAEADQRVVNLYRTEAIIWTLEHDGVPMSPVQINRRMRELGRNDPDGEVQVTTYDLWRQGRIAKISRGVYCSNKHIPAGVSKMQPPTGS